MIGYALASLSIRASITLARLVPCGSGPPSDVPRCSAMHAQVAQSVAVVALFQPAPASAIARLLGLCAHEGRCVEVRERGEGNAITPWQLDGDPPDVRARILADMNAAAWLAWGRSGGDFSRYACGGLPRRCPDAAASLRRYVAAAEWAGR